MPFANRDERKAYNTKYMRGWHARKANDPTYQARRKVERKNTLMARVARNKEIINDFKTLPCADCGQYYHPAIIEFDHVPDRGPMLFRIGSIGGKSVSEETLLAEIAKCDVVCANCHRMRTFVRNNPDVDPKVWL